MKPIDFPARNGLVAAEIPVNRDKGITLSLWQAGWSERLSILIHGKVWLAVEGDFHPPLLLCGNRSFTIELEEDDD